MRTAALAVLMCLLVFTIAPVAHAETSREQAPSELQGTYYTKGGKHYVDIELAQSDHPQGTWIITLNGSDEQSSPEQSKLSKFTSEYEDLVAGRNYQVIAVFYGKNGDQPIDVNACFRFQAQEPTKKPSDPVALEDCGFGGIQDKLTEETQVLDKADDAVPSDNGSNGNDHHPEGNTGKGHTPTDKEESGTLFHMNSGQSDKGGPMPDTAADHPTWAMIGAQLLLIGMALLGLRPAATHRN